ncbi:hypothetical protein [Caballeronia sp. LZ024]|nr:hypothetical protein [Caballeronia sp. LZ024]MDR5755074.1 hypothetical protein [Caballeronia sp. LZ024]MDR5841563.1 hypothetical protein [Caballeronia sp. LZ031]
MAGSLCIFGPSVRVTEQRVEEFGDLLKRATKDLSRLLGHQSA